MKYTIKLLNTGTEQVTSHVIEPADNEPAEDAALDLAISRGLIHDTTYLVVDIARGDD